MPPCGATGLGRWFGKHPTGADRIPGALDEESTRQDPEPRPTLEPSPSRVPPKIGVWVRFVPLGTHTSDCSFRNILPSKSVPQGDLPVVRFLSTLLILVIFSWKVLSRNAAFAC
jgi:hypothetical protein